MLKAIELLLTAEIYNRFLELSEDDIPAEFRKVFYSKDGISRPLVVKIDQVSAFLENNSERDLKKLPFIDYNSFTKQLRIISLDIATKWFLQKAGKDAIEKNPVLAYYYQNYNSLDVSYEKAKKANKPRHADKEWLETIVNEMKNSEEFADMLTLVKIYSPEDIKVNFEDVVLNEGQTEEIKKIEIAIEEREYLKRIGLTEIGKLLFIGPPGTGKTTTARALSKKLQLPLLEVRLSMVTSQYLGETSRNIEKIFEIAKKLNPCILFIDEFDYVAKTRTSDEHAAVKRAVNTLLKSIDEISLVEDGVLLIAATNHPHLLDPAVWRRFDKVVEFPLPPESMRRRLFETFLSKIDGEYNIDELVKEADGFSGAEIKLVVREAVLRALMRGEKRILHQDLIWAINEVKNRPNLKLTYNTMIK